MTNTKRKPQTPVRSTRLVGQFGEFTGGDGNLYACRVEHIPNAVMFRVKYWRADQVRQGWIPKDKFRPLPNSEVSSGAITHDYEHS